MVESDAQPTTCPQLFQEPLPILRFTVQFPWVMKSGNSAKFAEKHDVRKACSLQIEKAVTAIYCGPNQPGERHDDHSADQAAVAKSANAAKAALAGIAIAIKSYLSNPRGPLAKLKEATAEALKEATAEALKEAGKELRKAGLALRKAGLALRKAGEELEKATAEALKEAGKEFEKATAEALKEAGKELRKAGLALRKAGKELEKATADSLKEAGAALGKATVEGLQNAGEKLWAAAALWKGSAALVGVAQDNGNSWQDALVKAARLVASVEGGATKEDQAPDQAPPKSLVRTPLHIYVGISDSPESITVDVEWPVLVKKNARCLVDLDVEVATKEPGWARASGLLESGPQGPDLDNLLKTICDGLRFPGDQNANPDAETCVSIAEGRPFYCLVEDDALIRQLNSRMTVLLEDLSHGGTAKSNAGNKNDDAPNARVTVNVTVLSYRFPSFSGNAASAWSPDIRVLLEPCSPPKRKGG